MLSFFKLASYHVVTTFININTFTLHNYSSLFMWMFISSYANALGHLSVSHSYLTLLGFHRFIVHFIISLLISSYANALGHVVYLTLVLNRSRVSSFYYIHLRFSCFNYMLDLWVYTYKPWGFIHCFLKWFISS